MKGITACVSDSDFERKAQVYGFNVIMGKEVCVLGSLRADYIKCWSVSFRGSTFLFYSRI